MSEAVNRKKRVVMSRSAIIFAGNLLEKQLELVPGKEKEKVFRYLNGHSDETIARAVAEHTKEDITVNHITPLRLECKGQLENARPLIGAALIEALETKIDALTDRLDAVEKWARSRPKGPLQLQTRDLLSDWNDPED